MSSSSAPTDQSEAWLISPGSADWPEKRTSDAGLSVASPKPIARPAIASPSTGMRSTMRGSTRVRTATASSVMPRPRNGASSPNATA